MKRFPLAGVVLTALVLCGTPCGARPARAQSAEDTSSPDVDLSFLTTRAEASNYRETTRYDAVNAFLDVLVGASERVHRTTFGYSVEGRPLPLAVFGDVESAAPEAVRRPDGKTRVFVMADIHAGEVAGKEAALTLLRTLAAGLHARWADSLIVLVAPIYNADGNEDVSLYHRPYQLGPVGGMGRRTNAQGLDLNRDHMKLASPEARSLVRLFRRYDPHVVLDLHTTDGSHHGYHLTYSPPLHPSTPASIVRLLREEWLPAVRRSMQEKHGYATYEYGVVGEGYYGRSPGAERGWYTFSHRPRFSNNYVGLRGRFGILAEAYAYAPFKERILASLYFTEGVLAWTYRHAAQVRRIAQAADRERAAGDTVALRATYARTGTPKILMGAVDTLRNPYTGRPMLRRRDVQRPVEMPEYTTFRPTLTTRVPRAYYLSDTLHAAIDRLQAHGIRHERLETARTLTLERFRIDSVSVADQAYQKRHAHRYYGAYETEKVTLPKGTVVVPGGQPLGRLAALLLEPRSDDGLAYWAFFEGLGKGDVYPILRRPAR